MKRNFVRLLFAFSLLLPLAHPAAAQLCTDPYTTCRSQGHATVKGSLYPYSEDIANAASSPIANVTVTGPNSPWTIVSTGCVQVGQDNLFPGADFNLRMLAYLQIGASTVAPGGRYSMQFLIDGVPHGWYTRTYKGMLPQADWFGAIATNISGTGPHKFEVQVRVISAGQMTFTQQWVTSMGAPTSFPYLADSNSAAMTIDNTWRQVTNSVTFTNSAAVDLYPMSYLQWNSGTANDNITVKFLLDGAEPPHNSDVAVPPNPLNAAAIGDGVNIFDHLKNVPPGTHTLSLWAKNNLAHTASVSNREIAVASYPAASAHPSNPILTDAIAYGALTIDPTVASTDQPSFGGGCGYWTKILEFDIPPVNGTFNWTGEGYVRLVGNRTGDWSNTHAQFAIEAIAQTSPLVASDMGWVAFSPPNGQGEIYFFADSMLWGNGNGQKIKVWMRTLSGCGYSTGTFDIGRRYISLKLVPTDGMYCYNN